MSWTSKNRPINVSYKPARYGLVAPHLFSRAHVLLVCLCSGGGDGCPSNDPSLVLTPSRDQPSSTPTPPHRDTTRNRRLLRRNFGVHGFHQAENFSPGLASTVRDPSGHRRRQPYAAASGGLCYLARRALVPDNVGRVGRCAFGRVGSLSLPPGREASAVVRVSRHDALRGRRCWSGTCGLVRRLIDRVK